MPKASGKLILVTGATGKQGGAVLRHLRERGFSVRAMVRDPSGEKARPLVGPGIDVVRGDLDAPASISRALDGAFGMFLATPMSNPEEEVRRGKAAVDAARKAGLSHLVFSSVGSADQNTGIPHFDSKFRIEEHLRSSGLSYTIFRPVFFMENWLGMRGSIEQGTLALPLTPETHLQMIAVDDIAEFATLALEHPGRWQGRAVDIAGDDLSMTELAQTFSRVTGREVRYLQAPWEEFEKQAGPEITIMYRWFQDVGYHVDIPALRQENPKLSGFDRWLQSHWTKRSTA